MKIIFLVGTPNVGKSALFNCLTDTYTTVSNYPGTTVDMARGRMHIGYGANYEVIDTPGLYSLLPITEEEHVTRRLLMQNRAYLILHVVDAKNLRRMLPMTLQLLEACLPIMLVINMMDEAEALGIKINKVKMEEALGIPVVLTAAARKQGIGDLRRRIHAYGKL